MILLKASSCVGDEWTWSLLDTCYHNLGPSLYLSLGIYSSSLRTLCLCLHAWALYSPFSSSPGSRITLLKHESDASFQGPLFLHGVSSTPLTTTHSALCNLAPTVSTACLLTSSSFLAIPHIPSLFWLRDFGRLFLWPEIPFHHFLVSAQILSSLERLTWLLAPSSSNR